MYITQEADYAVRIVHCLAKCNMRRDARSISEEVHVTLRFSLKILGKLSAAGIVKSFKGNKGGYELAHSPADITLRDVLGAVEGPYVMSRCITEGSCSCGSYGTCSFQKAFSRISNSINQQLQAVSFQNLMDEDKAVSAG
ncbi:Rrf2 family transcriptional regulator [Ruminococcaceae bacterium OttesenSCG-928-A16]|nr:Rrf2 family transcriptional regulator [Ruminococcaceae bacterium OttesenSCG-928-A16]